MTLSLSLLFSLFSSLRSFKIICFRNGSIFSQLKLFGKISYILKQIQQKLQEKGNVQEKSTFFENGKIFDVFGRIFGDLQANHPGKRQNQKMQQQGKQSLRNQRISNIRDSLRKVPIITKNTVKIEQKLKTFNQERCSPIEQKNYVNDEDNNQVASMEDIHQRSLFEDKYKMGEKIGEGAHGFVSKCTKLKSGKLYAVKSQIIDDEHIMNLKQNFLSIHAINHPNIVQYQALYLDMSKKLCRTVMQYVDLPSLQKVKLNIQHELKEAIYQLLECVKFLHSKNISHRDLKPENILYDAQNKIIKVIDFGTSKQFIRRNNKLDMLTITGTLFYRAPEIFTGGGYDQKVDIWSIGIIIYKLVCGKTPFESIYLSDTINNIIEESLKFQEEVWSEIDPSLKNLIRRMLKKDKSERLSASQCLIDAWFYSLTLDKLIGQTRSHRQLPIGFFVRQLNKHKTLHHPNEDVENEESSNCLVTEVKHKIDGEDCFVFDSQQQDRQQSSSKTKKRQKKEARRKRSGSICI